MLYCSLYFLDNVDMSNFQFIPSKEMKVDVSKEQQKQISSKESIKKACKKRNVIAFDIIIDDKIIGFAMLRRYARHGYFLWDYAIDKDYQNKGYGSEVLKELFSLIKNKYKAKEMTTTYIWGNEHAKHLYEKVGFVETDVVDEPDCHEVNMIIKL